MPKGKDKKDKKKGKQGFKDDPQKKADEKGGASPLSPMNHPPLPGDTPLEESTLDEQDYEGEDFDDGASTGSSTPGGKSTRKRLQSFGNKLNPFHKKKDKEKKPSSRKASSSSIESPTSPQGATPLPKQTASAVTEEFNSSFEVVPDDQSVSHGVQMQEFDSEPPGCKPSPLTTVAVKTSDFNTPSSIESKTAPKLDLHIPEKDPRDQLSSPAETLTPSSIHVTTPGTPTNSQQENEALKAMDDMQGLLVQKDENKPQQTSSNNVTIATTPGVSTPTNSHPLKLSQTSDSITKPTATGDKPSLGDDKTMSETSTSANSNTVTMVTPTTGQEPSLGVSSAATTEASGQDKDRLEESGAVFYVQNDSSTTDVKTTASAEDQSEFEKLQREHVELVRRQSEAEETIVRMRQESTSEIQRLRAESEDQRHNDIERILIEASNKHKEEMKQRLAEMERQNETALKITIDNTTRKVTAATGKALKVNKEEIKTLNAQLAERDEQMKELQEQKEEFDALKLKLADVESKTKEQFTRDKEEALLAKENELKEQHEAQLREKNTALEKLEADKQEIEELMKKDLEVKEQELKDQLLAKDKETEELQQQLTDAREKDETEKLKADIEQKDGKIKQLEDELETAKETKEIDHPLMSDDVSGDTHTAQLETETETQKSKELYNIAKQKQLSEQLKDKEDSLDAATAENDFLRGRLEKSEKEVRRLQDENETLKIQYDQPNEDFQQHREQPQETCQLPRESYNQPNAEGLEQEYKQLLEEHMQLKAEYGQLKVIADLKRQMPASPPPPGFSSSVDPDEPPTQLSHGVPSNVLHQISTLIDPETSFYNAQLQPLSDEEVKAMNQAIRVQETNKPPAYVFAVFLASNSTQSMLLDYTGQFQVPQRTSDDEGETRSSDEDHDEEHEPQQFHTALQSTNMTDTEKVDKLEKQLEQYREESTKLREELDRLRDPEQEATLKRLRDSYLKVHDEKMKLLENLKAKEKEVKRLSDKKKELLEKLEARDEDIKQLREQKAGGGDTYPNVTRSLSADGATSLDDPRAEVVRLGEVLEEKDKKIESLEVQTRSFQHVASEREKLQGHSQDQSRTVMKLKDDLKAAQDENRVLKDESETAKLVETLQLKLKEARTQLSAAVNEKAHLQDEIDVYKNEVDAERGNVKKLQAQRRSPHSPFQQELTEKEAVLGQLQTQLNLAHAELSELKAQKERELDEIETENARLHQRVEQLSDSKEEIEKKYRSMVERLQTLDQMKQTVDDVRTQASTLTTITTANNKRIEELKNEVEVRKQEALQYKEDFEKERKDRENAVGRHVEEIASWQLACQKLKDDFDKLEAENQEKITEHWQTTYQKLQRERHEDQEAFQQTQQVLEEEINTLKQEKEQKEKSFQEEIDGLRDMLQQTQTGLHEQIAKLNGQITELKDKITELKEENIQQRNNFDAARAESEHHIADLNKKHDAEKEELSKRIAELEYEAEVMNATKASLDEKVEDIETKLHAKEKNLEIALNEKAALNEHLGRVRQQLDETVKESSVELMGKNQQVKQFRKQVEEITGLLQNTRAELDGVKGQYTETRAELDRVVGQLQQTRARMKEFENQLHYYKEQLQKRDEDDEEKDKLQESDKQFTQNELRQLQERYDKLRDRYDVMFKHNDQLKATLRKHNISPPSQPKGSHRPTPPHYQTEQLPRAQHDIQAVPILTRAPDSPIDPNTLPQPAVQVQPTQVSQYLQAGGGGQAQYPYTSTAGGGGVPGGSQLAVQGQRSPGYQQANLDPSQYQMHGGRGMTSVPEGGFISSNLEELRRNQIQMQGGIQSQGRIRTGSGGSRDDMNYQNQRGRQIQPDGGQKSLTEMQVRAVNPNLQFNQSNQGYAQGQALGQFSNQPVVNQGQWRGPPSQSNYNTPQQQQANVLQGVQQGGGHYMDNLQQQQQQQQQQHGVPVSMATPGQQHQQQLYQQDPTKGLPRGSIQAGQYQQRGPGQYDNVQQQQQQQYGQGMVGTNQGYGKVSPQIQQHQQQMQGNQFPPTSVASGYGQPQGGMPRRAVAIGTVAGQQQQQQQPGQYVVQAQQGSQMRHPYENQQVPPNRQVPPNPSGPQENVLIKGIDDEIQYVAQGVKNEGQEESLTLDAPVDPNLICQMCKRGFRIGEIQKYRRHVATCTGSSAS